MKKLAIISSYNESCGNASYTEALRKEFTKYYDVDVLALKVSWLVSKNEKIHKLADSHIEELCEKIKKYDYVNIQFEAGLYGSHPNDIIKRVKKLIDSSKNLIFTMHRIDLEVSIFDKNVLKGFLSYDFISNLRNFWRQNYFPRVYSQLIKHIKNIKNKNIQIIVHTKKDCDTIKYAFDFDNVHDFPLTFLNGEELHKYAQISDNNKFRNEYGLEQTDKIIGLFGFITDYKSHETAIKALRFLPENYKIIIFGSQHPMSITQYEKINPYLNHLLSEIEYKNSDEEEKTLHDRVLFAGNLGDEEFLKALHCVDYVVLPYLEVNQGGSGIASLAIETKAKTLFSNNKAFAELKRYFPDCFVSFDIGNYHELAYKIMNYRYNFESNIDNCLKKYNIEENIKFHKKLFEVGDMYEK